jgi:putative acyl-CoA dehydrogenase
MATSLPEATTMFEVQNQPPPLEPYNLFASDVVLREAVKREGAGWAQGELSALGATFGKPETVQLGFDANKFPPQLRTLDRYGHRLDEVEFHPAWHELLGIALKAGLHSSPWAEPKPGAHVARAAGTYMLGQIESGVYCPVAMTYGSVPSLRHTPAIAAEWLPRIFSREYDRRFRPPRLKTATLIGMGMTENQGGSDLRMNTTRAEPSGDGAFRLFGHKWFMSAPMCDAFLVLAQSPKGLSCFLMPRWTPEGERNAMRILRLKDKLGNRSNASSEVEFHGAYAQLIGEEGRGIPTIIEMGNYTRLDCCIGSSALMRQAVAQAVHHARHRTAFQKRLIDQPLMTNVLADLALESEAAIVLTMRLARAYDEDNEAAQVLRRVVTPAAKFWICKRTPFVTYEAMEVLGGSGYIEECIMPRLYREAPVNSIWEGSGNIMCLDVLRAIERTPNAAEMLLGELGDGKDTRLSRFTDRLRKRLVARDRADESQARVLVRDLVLALQATLLVEYAPSMVADAFYISRLDGETGSAFGLLPRGVDLKGIAERSAPAI